jgi:hypothetical protein
MVPAALRRWHSYIGLLTAPSLIFFSLTGAYQIFGLHEAEGDYHPPALLEKLSSVHRDQVLKPHHGHDDHDDHGAHDDHDKDSGAAKMPGKADQQHPDDDDEVKGLTLVLKWYFTAVAVALTVSALLGIWMGITQIGRRSTSWALLLAGILIPLALLLV